MKFYCIWKFFIFLMVIWLIDAAKSVASNEKSDLKNNITNYIVHYHNYAKDQEIMPTEMEAQASEIQPNLQLIRTRDHNKKQRHIIHVKPQRKRGFVRHQNFKKYYNNKHNNKKNINYNNNNNENDEIIRTYEEVHEHIEDNENYPETHANDNPAAKNYLNGIEYQRQQQQQQQQQQQENLNQNAQQQQRYDQHSLIDTQMEASQQQHHHHHHHMTHDDAEDEIKEEKNEKIKIKHHHHHHHHNHVKEIIKKVPEPYPVEKIVRVPVEKIVEKIVHVPKPYPVEKVVHVPVEKIIEKIVHVPKPYPVEKVVHVPVEKIVEKIVHIPKPYPVEKIVNKVVHVPKPFPVIRPMPYAVEVQVPVAVEKPMPYPVLKRVPVPYKVEVEKKIPIFMKHPGHNFEQQRAEEERQERHREEIEENDEEAREQEPEHEQYERDQYGYGSNVRYQQQETIYGKPQTMSQIYAHLRQQNDATKSAIRDILVKQQLKNLGYQKIPATNAEQESKNNYVRMASQPSTFKINVDQTQQQQQFPHQQQQQQQQIQQNEVDLQHQASDMVYDTQPQMHPFQLFHIQAMPFQTPMEFSIPVKT